MQALDVTKLIEQEGWDCAVCGHRHAGSTLAYICVGCPCPEGHVLTGEGNQQRSRSAVDPVADRGQTGSTRAESSSSADLLVSLTQQRGHLQERCDVLELPARAYNPMRKRAEQLEIELDEKLGQASRENIHLRVMVEQAEAQRDALQAALTTYGQHRPECMITLAAERSVYVLARSECTCGYDAALALAEGAK